MAHSELRNRRATSPYLPRKILRGGSGGVAPNPSVCGLLRSNLLLG
jgi:hypothetical protein